jgi:signal transduction histidine kinase
MGEGRARGVAVTAAVAGWLLLLAAIPVMLMLESRVRAAGRGDLVSTSAADFAMFGLAASVAAGIGTALMLRHPRHPVGWLFLGLGISVVLSGLGDDYGFYAALARPGGRAGAQVATLSSGVWLLWFVLVALILFLTPTGRPVSRAWGIVAAVTTGLGILAYGAFLLRPGKLHQVPFTDVTNPWGVERFRVPLGLLTYGGALATAVGFAAGGISLVVRFRRARGDERRQLLWLALAVVPLPAFLAGSFVAAGTDHQTILGLLTGGYLLLIPVAAGLSVVRYRLYDVERILSRAASYTLLTLVLGAVYVGTVLFAVWSLRDFSGRSQVSTAAATLATVSVAAPARRWLQDAVDRRFSRRRFTALSVVREALRGAAAERDLDEVLRRALADPTLRVAYLVQPDARWVSADGAPVSPAAGEVLVHRYGQPVASIGFDPAHVDRTLVEAVAAEAAPELENVALRAAVALRLGEVRESRARIVDAQLAERHRIERNLHDGAQQRLLALAFQLRAAQLRARAPELEADLDDAIAGLQEAVGELRALANGLHPSLLVDGGLAAALEDLAARAPVPVHLDVTAARFPAAVEAAAWFVASEAVTNAVKHADARDIDIRAWADADGTLFLRVRDDGVGGADPTGPGLRGIADRAEAAGGRLRGRERVPGPGTVVEMEIPCASS